MGKSGGRERAAAKGGHEEEAEREVGRKKEGRGWGQYGKGWAGRGAVMKDGQGSYEG